MTPMAPDPSGFPPANDPGPGQPLVPEPPTRWRRRWPWVALGIVAGAAALALLLYCGFAMAFITLVCLLDAVPHP